MNLMTDIAALEKRIKDLEDYVYNMDDFLPARSLIDKVIIYLRKQESVSITDLVKRFRISPIRAQKLIDLFISYEYISKEVTEQNSHEVLKESFGIYVPPVFNPNYEDKLLEKAKEIVLKAKTTSPALLQRLLSIGYAHAARIMDNLEALGIVGPLNSTYGRAILGKKKE